MNPESAQVLPVNVALQQAIADHQAGRLEAAEQVYHAILHRQPGQSDANHNLGVLKVQIGRPEEGLPYFKAALEIDSSREQYSLSYANALLAVGQADEAIDVLHAAMQLGIKSEAMRSMRERAEAALMAKSNADSCHAHFHRGNSLRDLGQLDGAIASFKQAIALKPDYADAYNNLGNVLRDRGQIGDAVASFHKALEINPEYAAAHYNLGNALRVLRRFEEAAASYRSALAFKLDLAEVHNNLGITLRDLGQPADAVASYRRALSLAPNYAEAHSNLGVALRDLRQLDESIASSRRALALNPGYADAHYNLGVSLANLGQLGDAVTSYRQALAIKPGFPEAHNNLGNALADQGQLDEAIACYRQALAIKPDFPVARSNLLFQLNYLSEQPAAMLLNEARHFGELVAQRAPPHTEWPNLRDPHRCLRVGLVSSDLRDHPVGYFIEGILAEIASQAPANLEFIAYDNHSPANMGSTKLTERIKACCSHWRATTDMSDEELAQQIRADEIDILIDLSGHTADNRLPVFAWKPAPVQVSWLGYFATTGLAAIDYLIADPWTMLESEEAHFTEKIWRLPETRLCFTQPDEVVDVSPLPALENGYFTFGCFNTLTKMNDSVVALWAKVLQAVPNSRLFLKAKQLDEEAAIANVKRRFAAHNIDGTRLMLEGPARRSDYLASYHRVDIALDPFPFPGGATSAEALWMGVPVLSLSGKRFLSRQGVGLLMNAGLPEWIAADEDDYVARAISHAGDLQRLAALRKRMRQQVLKSPLFDAHRFAVHFEAGLRTMWTTWCDQHRRPDGN